MTEWRCFHCDDVFTDAEAARDHFGRDLDYIAACQIKGGAERGLVRALRNAEAQLNDTRQAIADESTEAARAYYAQTTRHHEQLRAVEEEGYERGLADGRAEFEALSVREKVLVEALYEARGILGIALPVLNLHASDLWKTADNLLLELDGLTRAIRLPNKDERK